MILQHEYIYLTRYSLFCIDIRLICASWNFAVFMPDLYVVSSCETWKYFEIRNFLDKLRKSRVMIPFEDARMRGFVSAESFVFIPRRIFLFSPIFCSLLLSFQSSIHSLRIACEEISLMIRKSGDGRRAAASSILYYCSITFPSFSSWLFLRSIVARASK